MLVALLHGAKEMLASVLHPFHRSAEQLCSCHDGDILRIDAKLRTEAATHVGGRDAQAVFVETKQGRQRIEEIMRLLGGRIHDQRAVGLAAFDRDTAPLDRMRPAAMRPEALAENMRGVPKRGIDVAITEPV